MLNANRILQWHDNKDPTAAIYLGYPLTSSTQQMSSYLDSIITKVKRHADILAQRGLSIQGRSVVANSLLLSRIWHSIRILCPPQSFFQRIRSIIIKFLRCKNFPSVKFQDCRRPRYAALSPSVAMAYPGAPIDAPGFDSGIICYSSYAILYLCTDLLAFSDSAFTFFRKA